MLLLLVFRLIIRGWNSSLVVCWSCCPAWCSIMFHPPLGRIFLVNGISLLELTWVLTPFPHYSFGWEYKPRSVDTCIPLLRLQRSWHSCPRQVNAGNKNTPSMHLPRKWNVTTSMVGLRNGHIISPKMVNPRDVAGEHRRRREDVEEEKEEEEKEEEEEEKVS